MSAARRLAVALESAVAWDAARDAAWDAARAAAWAAASDAARAAASDALAPTVDALQESACELVRAMCAVNTAPADGAA